MRVIFCFVSNSKYRYHNIYFLQLHVMLIYIIINQYVLFKLSILNRCNPTRELQSMTVANKESFEFYKPYNKWDITKLLVPFSIYDDSWFGLAMHKKSNYTLNVLYPILITLLLCLHQSEHLINERKKYKNESEPNILNMCMNLIFIMTSWYIETNFSKFILRFLLSYLKG